MEVLSSYPALHQSCAIGRFSLVGICIRLYLAFPFYADPDPHPSSQNGADSCGSGSATLLHTYDSVFGKKILSFIYKETSMNAPRHTFELRPIFPTPICLGTDVSRPYHLLPLLTLFHYAVRLEDY
jgi:hypothetical protein